MARTIESIVESHKIASERRAAGKPIWDRRVDIRSIIREDQSNTTPEIVAMKANRIAKLLRAKLPADTFNDSDPEYDMDLNETIEWMEECSVSSLAVDLENGVTAVNMFNDWLTTIYDWADRRRIWLG